jgi:hypothetical protein
MELAAPVLVSSIALKGHDFSRAADEAKQRGL